MNASQTKNSIMLTGCPHHSRCASHKPSGDLLQCTKVDSHATESRVELHNNHGWLELDEWIKHIPVNHKEGWGWATQMGPNWTRHHSGSHELTSNQLEKSNYYSSGYTWALWVFQNISSSSSIQRDSEPRTVNREPAEYPACFHATLHLIHPLIVKCHPSWSGFNSLFARFRVLPEPRRAEVPVRLYRVQTPFSTSGKSPEAECCGEDRACGRRADVAITSDPENDWAKQEDYSW